MSEPLAFIGDGAGGKAYLVDDGYQDGGVAFDVGPVQPLPIAPGGANGEAIFHTLYLALTHTMACTLRVTPIVEDVEQTSIDIALQAQVNRTERVLELALSAAYTDPITGNEELRHAIRGTWFTARLETVGGVGDGVLVLNGLVVEVEVVRESMVAENAA